MYCGVNFEFSKGITAGDVQAAKKALKSMRRVASGLDSGDDDKEQTSVSSVHQAKSSELTVARSGKKFIVRKNVRSNIIELGRYFNSRFQFT